MRSPVLLRPLSVMVGVACCTAGLTALAASADLVLELATPKTEYLLDQPLFVTVTLRNDGPSEVQILRYLHPGAEFLTLEIVPPGEQPHQYKGGVSATFTLRGLVASLVALGPGEQYSDAVDFTFGESLLSRPGEWVIRAAYAVREGLPGGPVSAVRSNELSLVVAEPKGIDKAAYDLLQQGTPGRLWSSSSEQMACYEKVLRDFPDSGYAIHARLNLAEAYSFHAIGEPLRGTPDGAAALEKAAPLFVSVAEEAGDTPLGVYAKRLAGRDFARVGDRAQAQALFEEAFLSPAATDGDRLETLSWMAHLQNGYWWCESSKLGPPYFVIVIVWLPLDRFAGVLGFSAEWDKATDTVIIFNSKVRCTLQRSTNLMLVNGKEYKGVDVRRLGDGPIRVSGSVIAALMAQRYGEHLADLFVPLDYRLP